MDSRDIKAPSVHWFAFLSLSAFGIRGAVSQCSIDLIYGSLQASYGLMSLACRGEIVLQTLVLGETPLYVRLIIFISYSLSGHSHPRRGEVCCEVKAPASELSSWRGPPRR